MKAPTIILSLATIALLSLSGCESMHHSAAPALTPSTGDGGRGTSPGANSHRQGTQATQ